MVTKSLFVGFGKWSKEKKPTLSLSPFSCGCVSFGDLTTGSSWGGHCSTDVLLGACFHLLLTRKWDRSRPCGARAGAANTEEVPALALYEIQVQPCQSQTVFPGANTHPLSLNSLIYETVAVLKFLRVFGKGK